MNEEKFIVQLEHEFLVVSQQYDELHGSTRNLRGHSTKLLPERAIMFDEERKGRKKNSHYVEYSFFCVSFFQSKKQKKKLSNISRKNSKLSLVRITKRRAECPLNVMISA